MLKNTLILFIYLRIKIFDINILKVTRISENETVQREKKSQRPWNGADKEKRGEESECGQKENPIE